MQNSFNDIQKEIPNEVATRLACFLILLLASITISYLYLEIIEYKNNAPDTYIDIIGYGKGLLLTNSYFIFLSSIFFIYFIKRFFIFSIIITFFNIDNNTIKLIKRAIISLVIIFSIIDIDKNYIYAFLIFFTYRSYLNSEKQHVNTLIFVFIFLTAALYVFPIFLSFNILDQRLWMLDSHWNSVLGPGYFQKISDEINFPTYGFLMNKMLENVIGGTSMNFSIKFLQIVSAVFSLLIFLILYQRMRTTEPKVFLVAMFIMLLNFAPAISGLSANIVYPNLLPIRFLGVPIVVVASFYLAQQKLSHAWLLGGCLNAAVLMYNFETGVYCILGLGFALFIKTVNKGAVKLAFHTLIYAASFLITLIVIFSIVYQNQQIEAGGIFARSIFAAASTPFSGVAGLDFYFYGPFIFIIAHTIYLFSRYLSEGTSENLSSYEFQSIVMVGVIVVMGFYALYHFNIWNMWLITILYVLIVIKNISGTRKNSSMLWLLIITIVVAPFQYNNPASFAKRAFGNWSISNSDTCLGAVSVSEKMCETLTAKSNELVSLMKKDSLFLSDLNIAINQITGLVPGLSRYDYFFYANNKSNFQELVNEIRTLRAQLIFVDRSVDDNVTGRLDELTEFYFELLKNSGFKITDNTKYWWIAERTEIEKPD